LITRIALHFLTYHFVRFFSEQLRYVVRNWKVFLFYTDMNTHTSYMPSLNYIMTLSLNKKWYDKLRVDIDQLALLSISKDLTKFRELLRLYHCVDRVKVSIFLSIFAATFSLLWTLRGLVTYRVLRSLTSQWLRKNI